jgi:hypothetical protein
MLGCGGNFIFKLVIVFVCALLGNVFLGVVFQYGPLHEVAATIGMIVGAIVGFIISSKF